MSALPIRCGDCDAVCCRLTVVLDDDDHVPARLTTRTSAGLRVMARDAGGWCVAVDRDRHGCGIYENRPAVCRRFVMAGPYCRGVRDDYATRTGAGIPLALY